MVFGLVVGLAIFLHRVQSLWSVGHLVLGVLCLMCLIGMLMSGVSGHGPSRRAECAMTLHQIAWALLNYEQAKGCFPPAYIADKNGKPMHSWRVLLLPCLDRTDLYNAYDFNEPWDGPKNKKLSAMYLRAFTCPCDPKANATDAARISYVAVVGPNAAWAGEKPRKFKDFGKDASRAIMLVEVTNSRIAWAEPKDLLLEAIKAADAKSNTLALASNHGRREEFFVTYDYGSCVNVALADGSVHYLRLGNRSAEDLRKLLEIGGFKEEEIGAPELHLNWPNIAALAVWLLSVGTLLVGAVRGRKARSVPPPPAR